jgi:hypothetical protein
MRIPNNLFQGSEKPRVKASHAFSLATGGNLGYALNAYPKRANDQDFNAQDPAGSTSGIRKSLNRPFYNFGML